MNNNGQDGKKDEEFSIVSNVYKNLEALTKYDYDEESEFSESEELSKEGEANHISFENKLNNLVNQISHLQSNTKQKIEENEKPVRGNELQESINDPVLQNKRKTERNGEELKPLKKKSRLDSILNKRKERKNDQARSESEEESNKKQIEESETKKRLLDLESKLEKLEKKKQRPRNFDEEEFFPVENSTDSIINRKRKMKRQGRRKPYEDNDEVLTNPESEDTDDGLGIKIVQYETRISELSTENKLLVSQNEAYRSELSKIVSNLAKTKAFIVDRERIISEQNHALNQMKKITQNLKGKRKEQTGNLKGILRKMGSLENENGELKNKLKKIDELQEKNENCNKVVGELKSQVNEMRYGMSEKEKIFQKVVNEKKDRENKIVELLKLLEMNKKTVLAKEKKNIELFQIFEQKKLEMERNFDSERVVFGKRMKTMQQEYEEKISSIRNEHRVEREGITNRIMKKDSLNEKRVMEKNKENELLKHYHTLQIQKMETKILELVERIKRDKGNFLRIKKLFSKTVEKELAANNALVKLRAVVAGQKEEISLLKMRRGEYEKNREESGKEKMTLQSRLQYQNEQFQKLMKEKEIQHLSRIKTLKERIETLKCEKEQNFHFLSQEKKKREKLEMDIKYTTKERDSLQQKIFDYQQQISKTKNSLFHIEKQFEDEMNKLKLDLLAQSKFLQDRDETIETLKKNIKGKENEVEDLTVQVEELINENDELFKANEESEIRFGDQEKIIEEEKNKRRRLERELEQNFENIKLIEEEMREKCENERRKALEKMNDLLKSEKLENAQKDKKLKDLTLLIRNKEGQIKLCIREMEKMKVKEELLEERVRKFKRVIQNM